ncbi:MAG: methionine adenosyltransferase [Ignavibacteriales bacterium]
MNDHYLFTSESVSEGHPDKVADQISDAILDAHLAQDKSSRVACETLIAKNLLVIAGEITSGATVDFEGVAKDVIKNIGYSDDASGFNLSNCSLQTSISKQAHDIAIGVNQQDNEVGAGDQGLMFGHASTETPELMPLAISLAHKLVLKQAELRKNNTLAWLRPDAKSQVTVRYSNGKPVAVERVVLSTQHSPEIGLDDLRCLVKEQIIESVIPEELRSEEIKYFINPTGRFVEGGPLADTGLTGRKIIVDTYGGSSPHGGGAFSGKDPSKVDRSAAYAARYIAKNIVAAGLAEKCTIQLSYAIGVREPLSLMLNFHGTGRVNENAVEKVIPEIFNLTPRGIIEMLDLLRPIYQKTAAYGHFGRELPGFTWEKADRVSDLLSCFNI